jgi:putative oxidoreductase
MFRILISTDEKLGPFFLRLVLGIVIFAHGAQKVLGWFGGAGFSETVNAFTQKMDFPLWMVLLLMFIEFFGSLGLLAGFLTRLSALGIGCAMTVCAFMYHLSNGFFMNWLGKQSGEGFEYHILLLGICIALLIEGGGAISLDGKLSEMHNKRYYRKYR